MIIDIRSKGKREKFKFVLKGDNGEIIAQSEKYHNRQDCLDAVDLIMGTAHSAKVNDYTA